MQPKRQRFSNFSQAIHTTANCIRPDNEMQLADLVSKYACGGLLARGKGLSYSDCCVLHDGVIIDTSRLNHLLSFDPDSGIAVCQGGVTFADLLLIDPAFIPPVLPGTLHATVAGGVANDVHGKNNHGFASFGHHVEWIELQIGDQTIHCSREQNSQLFFASIGGLGLTGVIKRIGIRMRQASRFVMLKAEKYRGFDELLPRMQHEGLQHDYQVAWLDLLNEPRAILSLADHCESDKPQKTKPAQSIPKLPIRLINHWLIKQFNRMYYHQTSTRPQTLPLSTFNNPLDAIQNWNRLYGSKGLLQFQAVFAAALTPALLNKLKTIIHYQRASPTLAVLKYFTQPGLGLLSFVQPGFTLAIDFINNQQAHQAIVAMNQLISESGGRLYLAKDLRLQREQFISMYSNHQQFSAVLARHNSPMRSDLGKRLGLTNG